MKIESINIEREVFQSGVKDGWREWTASEDVTLTINLSGVDLKKTRLLFYGVQNILGPKSITKIEGDNKMKILSNTDKKMFMANLYDILDYT